MLFKFKESWRWESSLRGRERKRLIDNEGYAALVKGAGRIQK